MKKIAADRNYRELKNLQISVKLNLLELETIILALAKVDNSSIFAKTDTDALAHKLMQAAGIDGGKGYESAEILDSEPVPEADQFPL